MVTDLPYDHPLARMREIARTAHLGLRHPLRNAEIACFWGAQTQNDPPVSATHSQSCKLVVMDLQHDGPMP